jgi:glycosyltransferase involved in cell wall biosynthesis
MHISVIICTYKRADRAESLLGCLRTQTYRNFEVLLVDGSGDDSETRLTLRRTVDGLQDSLSVRLIESSKGLTLQRNTGLGWATGDLIVFLDDDVTFAADFLERMAALMQQPEMRSVGGATAYDTRNRAPAFTLRWKLRAALRVVPPLTPGEVDRLGRSVPVGFMQPFSGDKNVGYLPGFCMIYRRQAIQELTFDEALPTYGGEDRDFSATVGKTWKLVMFGDLQLEHHSAPESRDSGVQRTFQAGFGTGRSFAKNAAKIGDYAEFARVLVCEFALDALTWLGRPSFERFQMPFARSSGLIAGLRSFRKHAQEIS